MELLVPIGTWVVTHPEVLLEVVGFFALLATLTPNDSDNKIIDGLLQVVNTAGGNVGKAKNAGK